MVGFVPQSDGFVVVQFGEGGTKQLQRPPKHRFRRTRVQGGIRIETNGNLLREAPRRTQQISSQLNRARTGKGTSSRGLVIRPLGPNRILAYGMAMANATDS